MQPTEMSDFFERLAAVLALAPAPEGAGRGAVAPPGTASLFAPPGAAQAAPLRSLGGLCAAEPGIWPALAAEAEAAGDAAMAALCRALAAGLADGSLRPPGEWRPMHRLADFVYPVI